MRRDKTDQVALGATDVLNIRSLLISPLTGILCLLLVMIPAQAQTLNVLYTFAGGAVGATPMAGLTQDLAGNLYGTAEFGGVFLFCSATSCGTVYKVTRRGSGWVTTPVYSFRGAPDGATPMARVVFGADGELYGTTQYGGTGFCPEGTLHGCGTVFKLQPPPTACKTPLCPWMETVLYSFVSEDDGYSPQDEVTFDREGNIYGTTLWGGNSACSCGTVFKLTHNSDGSWTKTTLYSFQGGPNDGARPYAGVTLDAAGNIYGTTEYGGTNCSPSTSACGVIFKLTPNGSGWSETILHFFSGGADGAYPAGGLIFDGAGNLYGAAAGGGSGYGTVYELTPEQSGWTFAVLYSFSGDQANGPYSKLSLDASGNLCERRMELQHFAQLWHSSGRP